MTCSPTGAISRHSHKPRVSPGDRIVLPPAIFSRKGAKPLRFVSNPLISPSTCPSPFGRGDRKQKSDSATGNDNPHPPSLSVCAQTMSVTQVCRLALHRQNDNLCAHTPLRPGRVPQRGRAQGVRDGRQFHLIKGTRKRHDKHYPSLYYRH
jgi:hypothetical protein